jgi:hypothetical protein
MLLLEPKVVANMAKWKEMTMPFEVDMVDKPPHYNTANIECIDAMKAMSEGSDVSSHEAYCWQNSFKYLWRWPYKNGVEDLKKSRWYLDRLIAEVESNED